MPVRQIRSREYSRGRRMILRLRCVNPVAADVSPLIIPAGEKFEPTQIGCYDEINKRPARQSGSLCAGSLFRHAAILRGKFGDVNSAFTSCRRGRQRAAFSVPPAGSWRKSARGLAQSKTLREVRRPLENAPASWTAVALHRFRFKAQHGRTRCRWHGKIPGRR
jgi:hypothetical protein